MSGEIALLGYMLVCITFKWWNGLGCSSFCKEEKQPELPWCQHETISFHLGLNSKDLEIRWEIGEGGVDLEGCKSAGFSALFFL